MAILSRMRYESAGRLALMRRAENERCCAWAHLSRAALLAVAFLVLPAFAQRSAATRTPFTEYQVKAAFILNFARFIDWPTAVFPSEDSSIVIGILGEDHFEGAMERIVATQKVKGRTVRIVRFERLETVGPCTILFVSDSERRNTDRILERFRGLSVLTIGETRGFADAGGIINFVVRDETIRFEINVGAAERAGIRISSRLLRLADIVQ